MNIRELKMGILIGSATMLLPLASLAYNETSHAESTHSLRETVIGPALDLPNGPVDDPSSETPPIKGRQQGFKKEKNSKVASNRAELGHFPDKIDTEKLEKMRREIEEALKNLKVSHLLNPRTARSLGTKAGIAAAKAELRAAHSGASGDDKVHITKALNAIDKAAGQEKQAMLPPARRVLN